MIQAFLYRMDYSYNMKRGYFNMSVLPCFGLFPFFYRLIYFIFYPPINSGVISVVFHDLGPHIY